MKWEIYEYITKVLYRSLMMKEMNNSDECSMKLNKKLQIKIISEPKFGN